jgi:hypothetical protein
MFTPLSRLNRALDAMRIRVADEIELRATAALTALMP